MQVSKPVAIAVAAALVASLITIAYMIGRDHGRTHAQQPVATGPVAPAGGPAQPVAELPPPTIPTSIQPPPPVARIDTPAPPPPPPAYVPAPANAQPGDAAEVQAYFMRTDSLAGGSMLGGDNAQDTAEKLLSSAVSGDTSGFDALAKVASNASTAAKLITPPAACAHYHTALLAMLDDSTKLIQGLEDALKRNDTGALASFAMTAQTLQSHATALQQEAAAIKRTYGLH